jgi:aryl-alcohol dehydrogenase-like predicted oxidoreductase
LKTLQDEGKIGHIGLSEVDVDQLEQARRIADIVSVQNMFNLGDRSAEPLLDHAEKAGIAFIPWFPLAMGVSPNRAVSWPHSRRGTARRRRSSRSRGCCGARR